MDEIVMRDERDRWRDCAEEYALRILDLEAEVERLQAALVVLKNAIMDSMNECEDTLSDEFQRLASLSNLARKALNGGDHD